MGRQPRYGQPAPAQLDQLPELFTPRPPPLYFGTPTPPTLMALLFLTQDCLLESLIALFPLEGTQILQGHCVTRGSMAQK
jgi:hypothetical protein